MKCRHGFEQTKVTLYLLTDGNIIVYMLTYHSIKTSSMVTRGGLLAALMAAKNDENMYLGADGKMVYLLFFFF